jgi:3-phenylpropionate/trans-cinnamate dioxygenase ferredoxin subunit
MADVRIKTIKDGPYEIKGAVDLQDAKRNPFQLTEEVIYLCRCGQSGTKPFCDGTHSKCGFKAAEEAR